MTVRSEFRREDIEELLGELGQRLIRLGVAGRIYIAGGAAVVFEYPERRATEDIDAVFGPAETIREQVAEMAEEYGLPPKWLNDSVRAFLPPTPDEAATTFSVPGLAVSIASARHLLAMKMAAARPQDLHDLVMIFGELGITTPAEAADIAEAVHGPESVLLPPRQEVLLYAKAVLLSMQPPTSPDRC